MQNLEHALEQIGTVRIRENLRTFGKAVEQCSIVRGAIVRVVVIRGVIVQGVIIVL